MLATSSGLTQRVDAGEEVGITVHAEVVDAVETADHVDTLIVRRARDEPTKPDTLMRQRLCELLAKKLADSPLSEPHKEMLMSLLE